MPNLDRVFGTTKRRVPVVGQGTWKMEADVDAGVAAIKRGLDLGMTHIDTAEMYGDGDVERIVARAIEGRRDDVFLVSKVLPENASKADTIRACEQSLHRLGTDHLDVYLLHWRGRHPLAETVAAFESLVADGKIKAWGVSNFDVDDMVEMLGIAGPQRCACNQVRLDLRQRYAEGKLADVCAENNVALVAYSPLGCGGFPKPGSPGRAVLDDVARAHVGRGASGVDAYAVALAFLARASFVIPKASHPAHVEANARALSLVLSEHDVRRIDDAFPVRGKRLQYI